MFSDDLVLTAPGQSHSRWKLIDVLKDKNIKLTYHPDKANCIRDGYFQSTARGQEFIFDECDNSLDENNLEENQVKWLKKAIWLYY